ncbi:RING-H2 finger protein ATL20 [Dendrobium catenatum]|uniref:RING-H2 finger protein ATL20 n=1 Tax=Dendrobium catenatum TaxID=906689 RepID=A0A2I0X8Q2_9ASPA|nr:RING-H2 finger protein ATL20 [Dendrobium catenatum]PKU84295.1 RING-H2 finger protein ATL20 [Dendrobium catenatum]
MKETRNLVLCVLRPLMDREQHNRRTSVYLIILSFSITAALITIYHWITTINRRRRGRGMLPEFNGGATSGADVTVSAEASIAQLIAPAQTFRKAKEVGGEDCGSGGGEEMTCPVCLSEFKDGEAVRFLPECGHCFHVECIDMWFRVHSTCPVCRSTTFS